MFFDGFPRTDGRTTVQYFKNANSSATAQYQQWLKPAGATMVWILCLGGGGGGGGGFSGIAGSARGGGAGGSSSPISTLLIPALMLPNKLLVQVGRGGSGVTTGTGETSTISTVGIGYTASVATDTLLVSTSANVVGGASGTVAAGGAATAAPAATTIASMPLAGLGIYTFYAGLAGGAGGAQTGAVGAAMALPTGGQINMGGTGGAGTTSADFAGGLITAVANSVISQNRPEHALAGSNAGSGGCQMRQRPVFFYPGMGGASSNTGIGGNGGKGGYGSGGGGGGGGTTGGRGGDGGDGLVIIAAW